MIKTEYGIYHRESWESYCNILLKIKYDLDYQDIPASTSGDYGIEGFTTEGILFQCYCPDDEIDSKTLYDNQRDKVTRDLNKLEKNKKELLELLQGKKIKTWVFLTPIVKNKELVKHCKVKAKEYKENKSLSDLIDKNFNVVVHTEKDYLVEIHRKNNLINEKIYFDIGNIDDEELIDWKACADSLIIDTLIRKSSKLFENEKEPEKSIKINKFIDTQIKNFIKGQKVLERMKIHYALVYEKQSRVKSSIASNLEMEVMLNDEPPKHLLKTALGNYKTAMKSEKLEDSFEIGVLNDLGQEAVASWLMECLLDF
ncbi:hypothetical protein FQP34_00140 [Peribacillus simplex]|uniref:Uncharacterized protein n=1 Tax=Peribacillus simplex TaxID=1478 RepID=A0A8B5Y3L6_9BACI|nr:hypothetical protein [Peribacillus simplex]TVX83703.1 hypothetical protein FQP34_00140 [Peribacillus simplex]